MIQNQQMLKGSIEFTLLLDMPLFFAIKPASLHENPNPDTTHVCKSEFPVAFKTGAFIRLRLPNPAKGFLEAIDRFPAF